MRRPKIKHIKGSIFWVQSKSDPSTYHIVDMYRRTCSDCEANKYGKLCWHIRELYNTEFSIEPVVDAKLFREMDSEIKLDELGNVVRKKGRRIQSV